MSTNPLDNTGPFSTTKVAIIAFAGAKILFALPTGPALTGAIVLGVTAKRLPPAARGKIRGTYAAAKDLVRSRVKNIATATIEALAVAGHTPAEIAARMLTRKENVLAYLKLHFDISRFRTNRAWLDQVVNQEGPWTGNDAVAVRARMLLNSARFGEEPFLHFLQTRSAGYIKDGNIRGEGLSFALPRTAGILALVPLVVIFILAWAGMRSEALIAFQRKHTALAKALTGALFLALAVFLTFGHAWLAK
jgi:hypothetical protein